MHHEKSTQRPHGIGGSDIAALLGLSPYKTPLELWAEKVGHPGIKESQGIHLRFGQHVEPFIAREYERSTGLVTHVYPKTLTQTAFQGVKFWRESDLERLLVTAHRYPSNAAAERG